MRKTSLFFGALLLAALSPAFSAASETAPELVARWAKALNKPVVWEAGPQYSQQKIALTRSVDTSTLKGFQAAFEGLDRILVAGRQEPLKACVFTNAVVVRRQSQPSCDSASAPSAPRGIAI